MKNYAVLILMALSLAVAILLHSTKDDGNKGIDQVQQGLAGVQQFVKPGSRISFRTIPDNPELLAKARFALAPAVLQPGTTSDTTLVITTKDNDSLVKTIWEHSDSQFRYALVVK